MVKQEEYRYQYGLENLEVYCIAVQISDLAWDVYVKLPQRFQYGIGQQFLRAADSIGANIAEGFGRYHFRESINFNNFARGSAMELKFWIMQLRKRELTEEAICLKMNQLIDNQIKKINGFNNYLRNRQKSKNP